jgi:hypothetical protein
MQQQSIPSHKDMYVCMPVCMCTLTHKHISAKVRKRVSQDGDINLKLRRIHLLSNNRVLQQLIQTKSPKSSENV